MRDFRELNVRQESHSFTLRIYEISKNLPKEKLFGLISQMRRAASSISTNIAEGCGRGSQKDYAHFLQIAIGSAFEVDYQILLAKDLKYIDENIYLELNVKIDKIKRQLALLVKKIREQS